MRTWRFRHIHVITIFAFLGGASLAAQSLVEFEFNEGTGSAVTSKAGDLVGSLGAPISPDDDPAVIADSPSGKAGDTAVQLRGNGFLVVADAPNPIFRLQTNAFTLEAWINIDPADTRQFEGIIAYGNAYKMGLRNGELVFTLFTIVDIPSGLTIPLGEWHHVAVVWEPRVGVTFYLDGGTETKVAETRTIPTPANNFLNIGSERLSNPLMGSLDRVRVHKAVLTPDQLDSAKDTPKGLYESTLVSYNFTETKPPFQSAKTADRPAITSNEYQIQYGRPTFSSDTPSGLKGDYALQFAAGQRVTVPDPNTVLALDQDNPSFTIQAWVKFGAQPGTRSVYFYNNAPGGAVSASVTQDRRVFVTTLGIVDQTSTAFIPNDNKWHHIAVVHEFEKELRFYVDGTLGATVPYTRGTIFTRTNLIFYLGSESTGGLQYVGLLDRFRYSKGALAAGELDSRALPAGQTAPPTLALERAAQTMKLLWPAAATGFVLQKTADLNPPATWVDVTGSPQVDNANNAVSISISEPRSFFRLLKR
jgi:hypothetical protein